MNQEVFQTVAYQLEEPWPDREPGDDDDRTRAVYLGLPHRVQLSRAKGWRLPGNTVVVSRPSKWGNPHVVIDGNRKNAVALFAADVALWPEGKKAEARAALRGKNLACWCAVAEPCHADVLFKLVNEVNKIESWVSGGEYVGEHIRPIAGNSDHDD